MQLSNKTCILQVSGPMLCETLVKQYGLPPEDVKYSCWYMPMYLQVIVKILSAKMGIEPVFEHFEILYYPHHSASYPITNPKKLSSSNHSC